MSPKDFPQLPSTMANQQYCLKWNNHQSNLLRAFDRLLQSESFTDVTLACEGQSLRAHKVVLSACSSYFETLFEEHPDKSPIIILKDMRFTHVSQLVNFMYRGEINITQDMLSGLLKTAETLKVKGLAEVSGEQSNNTTPQPSSAPTPSTPQQFNHLQSGFRLGNHVSPLVASSSSALTAALNAPVVPSPHLPLSSLLNPDVGLDERRVNLLKRAMSQSQELENSLDSTPKIPRRENDSEDSLVHHSLPHLLNPMSLATAAGKTPTSVPLLFFNQNADQQHQKRQEERIKQERQEQKQQQKQEEKLVAAVAAAANLSSSSMPPSPVQPVLTPIPPEISVNAHQDLPDFLKGFSVYRLNDYLGFRTRQQFWEEPAVRRIMEAIKNKEIDMKSAAEIVGVSYGTLYGRYREVFGYLKHSWVNKPGRTPQGGQKDRSLWEESRAQELIQQVLNKELSLTAAAVRLGVDTNTFFAHLTDNGKNKNRVALLMGSSPGDILSADDLTKDSNHSDEFENHYDSRIDAMGEEDSNDPSEILRGATLRTSGMLEVNGDKDEPGPEEVDEMSSMDIQDVKAEDEELDVGENEPIDENIDVEESAEETEPLQEPASDSPPHNNVDHEDDLAEPLVTEEQQQQLSPKENSEEVAVN